MNDDDVLQLVFLSGLSTARRITDVSGRGVGLDVVLHGVDAVRGRIEVRSRPDAGTEFRVRVPITLAVLPCLLVSCADQRYAIPMHSVVVVREAAAGEEPLWVDGRPVPVTALARVLDLPPSDGAAPRTVVVVSGPTRRHGFAVDALLGQRDVVVKGLSGLLPRIDVLTGASIEPDGSVLCVLDGAGLVARSQRSIPSPTETRTPPPRRGALLVVDDALTVRELQRAILERAGYRVRTAADGPAALAALADAPADLVLTDVEMPGMDGFDLTRAIRATPALASVPVIILTSRATDEDRRRGLDAGADGYLLKSTFDQGGLIAAVERLLGPGR
jgi:two-component system chemotaxis sensor kinase CheA